MECKNCKANVNETNNEKLDLSADWITYITFLRIIFPENKIVYNNDTKTVRIYSDDANKAYAMARLLPSAITFGNVTLFIEIIPGNFEDDPVKLMKILFEVSPVVDDIITIQPDGCSNQFTYILFKNEVVEFWNDNLGDPHGLSFTLLQDIADKLFEGEHDGVLFTTSSTDNTFSRRL